MIKKARKRLGKSGIRTHDPKFSEIYLIKIQFTMLFFSKGRGGAGSSSIPGETLEPLLLGVKSPSLLNFTETRYLPWKFGKFVKNVKKLKPWVWIWTWATSARATIAQRLSPLGHPSSYKVLLVDFNIIKQEIWYKFPIIE